MRIRGILNWATFAAAGLSAGVATADELTAREKELMIVIESLKERVSALEEKTAQQGGQTEAAPALTERVEALESANSDREKKSDGDIRVYWKNGLNLDTIGSEAKLKIGGRVHNDWFWYDQDRSLQRQVDLEDGVEFRRARIMLSGTLYENFRFKAEYDFEEGDASFKDVFLELAKVPLVENIRVGHFKEPFSLEELVSSNDVTFMERALPNIFAPSRNSGVMVHRAFLGEPKAERMTLALGLFRTTDDFGNDADDGGYSGTMRVTGLPWYEEGGRRLLHLGAGYTHRNPDGDIRIRQRPESHDAERFVDTGDFAADDIDAFNLESALVYGPFSLQGEYFFTDVETEDFGSRDFTGYYAQASYFLTGEHRPYRTEGAVFDRVIPNRNFKLHGEDRGWGAWEVALRYSHLDLNDGSPSWWDTFVINDNLRGGEESNFTAGLNWYLNPNARIMLNYIRADIDSDIYEGDLNILQSRFQVAF